MTDEVDKPRRQSSRRSLKYRNVSWSYTEVAPSHLEFHEYATAEESIPAGQEEAIKLKVKDLGLNIAENTVNHNTAEYDITRAQFSVDDTSPDFKLKVDESKRKLVIRRGQNFDLDITFNRKYDKTTDDLRFVFEFGDTPIPSKATHIEFVISDENIPKSWGAQLQWQEDDTIKVRITTPPTVYVGKWTFMVDVIEKKDRKEVVFRYKHKDPFYILFNPWCKDDQVYFHDTDLLEEYVMNEKGRIFVGNSRRIDSFSWNFGQFVDDILDHTVELLDRSDLAWKSRGDPVIVSRKLTSLTNSQDNRGLLCGKWPDCDDEDPYKFGTSPTRWDGSVEIIKQYFQDRRRPVRYAQCWVYAGVLTTLCRVLGIPCRLLTNFESAHDNDGSITIDNFNGVDCDPYMLDLFDDSIWNFHCWNDAWMARPDLPEGYGGWQVIDGTPQERSDGVFCCGPMSVAAIKEGQVCLQYDGPFIYAEVNADKIQWLVYEDGTMEQISVNKARVGQFMSTNRPACKGLGTPTHNYWGMDRDDITQDYKYLEGTPEERASVMTANLLGSNNVSIYDHPEKADVKFDLQPMEDYMYGNGFEIEITLGNRGFYDNRTIDGCITASAIYYTGVKFCNIKTKTVSRVIEPFEYADEKLRVEYDEYADDLVSQCYIMVSFMFRVKETNQIFAEQIKFQLIKPKLGIQAPEEVVLGEKFEVEVFFRNPLPSPLTECCLRTQGSGLKGPSVLDQPDVEANDTYNYKFELVPLKAGQKEIVVSFHSYEMENVCGSCQIKVKEPPTDVQ